MVIYNLITSRPYREFRCYLSRKILCEYTRTLYIVKQMHMNSIQMQRTYGFPRNFSKTFIEKTYESNL